MSILVCFWVRHEIGVSQQQKPTEFRNDDPRNPHASFSVPKTSPILEKFPICVVDCLCRAFIWGPQNVLLVLGNPKPYTTHKNPIRSKPTPETQYSKLYIPYISPLKVPLVWEIFILDWEMLGGWRFMPMLRDPSRAMGGGFRV